MYLSTDFSVLRFTITKPGISIFFRNIKMCDLKKIRCKGFLHELISPKTYKASKKGMLV